MALEIIRIPVGDWYSPHSPLRDAAAQAKPGAAKAVGGARRPRAPGLPGWSLWVGPGLSPTFRVESSFGKRRRGRGRGRGAARARLGETGAPRPEAARSTAGAEPQPEQPEQLLQPVRARGAASAGLSASIPGPVRGEGGWGRGAAAVTSVPTLEILIDPAWPGHGLSTKHAGGRGSVSVLILTVWGPKMEKDERIPCKSIA